MSETQEAEQQLLSEIAQLRQEIGALRATVAERERAEFALREREQRYRTIAEDIPALICRFLPGGVLTFVNEHYCQYFARSRQELEGRSFFEFVPEEERELVRAHYAALTVEKPAVTYEHQVLAPDGTLRWQQWSDRALFDASGRPMEYQSIGLDITERKETEKALEESQALLQSTMESLPFDFFALGVDGRYVLQNGACSLNWGNIIGKRPSDVAPDADTLATWQENNERAFAGETVVREIAFPIKGELKRFHNIIAPISYEDQIRGILGVNIDITERMHAEQRLQASLREKEVLLREIHHRVKNNLQVISSLLNLQTEYIDDPSARELFIESRNRVRSMALVHERLYESPDLASIDLEEYTHLLCAYLLSIYRPRSQAIALETEISASALSLDTAIPCALILNELVTNALKHAFPDERRGRIFIGFQSDNGQSTLTVSDNGVGLPLDLDLQNTNTLGLRLVAMLVGQLEGSIELNRKGGTTFKIAFASSADAGRS